VLPAFIGAFTGSFVMVTYTVLFLNVELLQQADIAAERLNEPIESAELSRVMEFPAERLKESTVEPTQQIDVPAERLKESIEGIVSVAAFALAAVLLGGTALAYIMSNDKSTSSFGTAAIFALLFSLFGFVVGIGGLFQKNTSKTFSQWGICLNGILSVPCFLGIIFALVGAVGVMLKALLKI